MYRGDFAEDATIVIKFTTNDANGAPVAPSAAFASGDFVIYKGNSATQKLTTNGITVTSPFDSIAGRHMIVIDTSNDTGDAGFWATGTEYSVDISSAKTIDGQSQTGVEVGSFSIENRYAPVADVSSLATSSALATVDANVDAILVDTSTTIPTSIAAMGSGGQVPVVDRGVSDDTPLYFTFPTGSLSDGDFTKTKRIDGGASTAVSGTISYLYEVGGKHWYRLAYNAADRPSASAAGVVQFSFTDGSDTRVVGMNVVESGGASLDATEVRAAIGLASANLDTQLGTIDTNVDAVKAKTDLIVGEASKTEAV